MNIMNKNLLFSSLIVGALVLSPSVFADDDDLFPFDVPGEFSFNVALTTDYIYRGETQSESSPAIQGGIDYGVDITDGVGWYAGIWGSNVDWDDGTTNATSEFDFYTGIAFAVASVDVDAGFLQYIYPNESESSPDLAASDGTNYGFHDWYFSLGYDTANFLSSDHAPYVSYGWAWSPRGYNSSGEWLYQTISADIALYKSLAFSALWGDLWKNCDDKGRTRLDSYQHWQFGLSATMLGFGWDLTYHDTDGYQSTSDEGSYAGERVVFTMSSSW